MVKVISQRCMAPDCTSEVIIDIIIVQKDKPQYYCLKHFVEYIGFMFKKLSTKKEFKKIIEEGEYLT